MKLQRRLSAKHKGKTYYKWIITLPGEDIIDSGFKEGDDLKIESSDGKIVLTKKKSAPNSSGKVY